MRKPLAELGLEPVFRINYKNLLNIFFCHLISNLLAYNRSIKRDVS